MLEFPFFTFVPLPAFDPSLALGEVILPPLFSPHCPFSGPNTGPIGFFHIPSPQHVH